MTLSRLEFNPGCGGLESAGSKWVSIGHLEMNWMSSA